MRRRKGRSERRSSIGGGGQGGSERGRRGRGGGNEQEDKKQEEGKEGEEEEEEEVMSLVHMSSANGWLLSGVPSLQLAFPSSFCNGTGHPARSVRVPLPPRSHPLWEVKLAPPQVPEQQTDMHSDEFLAIPSAGAGGGGQCAMGGRRKGQEERATGMGRGEQGGEEEKRFYIKCVLVRYNCRPLSRRYKPQNPKQKGTEIKTRKSDSLRGSHRKHQDP